VKKIIFPAILFFLFGCKGNLYRAPTASMETTVKKGETFYVAASHSFKRNDIVLFNYYGDDYSSLPDENGKYKQHWEKRFYRLIAISGDTLLIKDGVVLLNGKYIEDAPTILNEYRVYAKQPIDDLPDRNEGFGFPSVKDRFGDTIVRQVLLTKEEVNKYEQRKQGIIKITRFITPPPATNDTMLARPAANLLWTVDNYGPLYIPKPGDIINVTKGNYKLYKNIPLIQPGKNTIKEKLCFVMGDNRHMAQDSRFLGFIAQSKMYGIVK
jgi:signal peptidase I